MAQTTDADSQTAPATKAADPTPQRTEPTAAPVLDDLPNGKLACQRYDELATRAQLVPNLTSACETFAPGLFGLRDALADQGIGVTLKVSPSILYDLRGHDAKTQTYGGQSPTLSNQVVGSVTVDLGRHGVPGDAQLTVEGTWQVSNYAQNAAPFASVTALALDQRFADGNIDIVTGYYQMIRQFYGLVLGGNASAAALGPVSVIPFQVGISANTPTPSLTVKTRLPGTGFYNTAAVTRSTSPDGLVDEADRNGSGLALTLKGDRVLLLDELGYKVEAAPGRRALWLRAGGIWNFTHYAKWDGTQSRGNYAAYVAATFQLTQPDGRSPRGLNLDLKADYAPGDRNLYKGDVQATAFYIGPFAGRPGDMASLGVTHNWFSKSAQDATRTSELDVATGSTAISGSYAMRLARGIYWVTGLTYSIDPAFAPKQPDAVLLQQTLNLAF